MKANKLILIGGLALALAIVPAAPAQGHRGGGGGRGGGGHGMGATGGRSFSGPSVHGTSRGNFSRSAGVSRAGRGNWSGSRGSWSGSRGNWSGNRGSWNHGHHGGNHHGHYRGGRGFYPYYAYDPFYWDWYGYGYGYGYPYYTSAAYYYDGYPAQGGSVAVAVQEELARAGYYHGAIDGILGDGSRRAIRAYERANGLPVDGRIDGDLLATMGLG